MGTQARDANQRNIFDPRSPVIGPLLAVIASALGIAIYGLARAGAGEFYNALGLTPEQAGYNQTMIIGDIAALLAALVLVFGVPLTVAVPFSRIVAGFYPSTSRRLWVLAVSVVVVPPVLARLMLFLPLNHSLRVILSELVLIAATFSYAYWWKQPEPVSGLNRIGGAAVFFLAIPAFLWVGGVPLTLF